MTLVLIANPVVNAAVAFLKAIAAAEQDATTVRAIERIEKDLKNNGGIQFEMDAEGLVIPSAHTGSGKGRDGLTYRTTVDNCTCDCGMARTAAKKYMTETGRLAKMNMCWHIQLAEVIASLYAQQANMGRDIVSGCIKDVAKMVEQATIAKVKVAA